MSRSNHSLDDVYKRQERLKRLLDLVLSDLEEDKGLKNEYWDVLGYLEFEVFYYLHDFVAKEDRDLILSKSKLHGVYKLWENKEIKE